MQIKKLKELPILLTILLIASVWLRLINLGYSDYQGDEIKALYLPESDQSFSEFIMDQRKGPLQFIITFAIKLIVNSYSNEFLVRLPFALAGIFAVFFFYKFVKLNFKNNAVAFYAAFLFSTNGFIVAFSRIVQYQAYVLLFMNLALYLLALAISKDKWKTKGLYLSTICLAISILAHYDGVFIFPFYLYLLFAWFKKYKTIKPLIGSLILPALMLGSFYIPFVLTLSKDTIAYWQNRLDGGSGKISSSIYLFRVYQPIYIVKIYILLALLGSIGLTFQLASANMFGKKVSDKLLVFINEDAVFNKVKYISLFLWFLAAYIFMEAIVNVPGTHVYIYLVPLFILIGYGIDFLVKTASIYRLKNLTLIGVVILLTFIFLQSHTIFVDHYREYPWENEKFLIWDLTMPSATYHLSLFGFPYYRNWEGISSYILSANNSDAYSTNERETIARYHIPLDRDRTEAGYYIYIKHPQSFLPPAGLKPKHWISKYPPVVEFKVNDRVVTSLYLMEKGDYDEIISKGY